MTANEKVEPGIPTTYPVSFSLSSSVSVVDFNVKQADSLQKTKRTGSLKD